MRSVVHTHGGGCGGLMQLLPPNDGMQAQTIIVSCGGFPVGGAGYVEPFMIIVFVFVFGQPLPGHVGAGEGYP